MPTGNTRDGGLAASNSQTLGKGFEVEGNSPIRTHESTVPTYLSSVFTDYSTPYSSLLLNLANLGVLAACGTRPLSKYRYVEDSVSGVAA